MKINYIGLFVLFSTFLSYTSSGQVIQFNFSGINGDETTLPSSYNDPALQPSVISRGPNNTASATADRFNSKGWATGSAPDLNSYIEFTLSPRPGYSISITTIQIQHERSTNGPKSIVARTSFDGFSANATNVSSIPVANALQNNSMALFMPINSTVPVTIRLYGFNAATTAGTWGPGQSADGLDLQVFGTMIILPLKFIDIKAIQKGSATEISFTNSSETAISHYIIEESSSGSDFKEIIRMQPRKNNNELANYYSDVQTNSNVSFYRISALELSGRKFFSSIIKVIRDPGASVSFSVFPNPVHLGGQLSLQMSKLPPGNYTINLYNILGKMVQNQVISTGGDYYSLTLPLDNLQRGIYIVEINGLIKLQKQLIIQ